MMRDYKEFTDEQLAEMIRTGDEAAMDYLLIKYKPVVKKQARSFYMPGADTEDLIQEGMIGLYHAIKDYDEGKGSSFHTFAELVISRKIMSAVKIAGRLKNQPLNEYISLDVSYLDGGEEGENYQSMLSVSEKKSNPEEIMIDKERKSVLEYELVRCLSKMEKEVFFLVQRGYGYREVAEKLRRTPKSVDNAISRIRIKYRKLRQ